MTGIFLGTFDPPHIGHMKVVASALDYVNDVLIVPAWHNPFKEQVTPYELRCTMLLCLLDTYNFFNGRANISYAEEDIANGNSVVYSYQTLQYLQEEVDDDICLIVTPETKNEIPKWKNGQWILDNINFTTIIPTDIYSHSTHIRNYIKNHKCSYPYINKDVYEIIKTKKLYL